jgi:coenzyme F420-0:L-glutamate ligase/coenzyme F420-1:gamma-L-glutamate ligase
MNGGRANDFMSESHTPDRVELIAFLDFPEVQPGDFLPHLVAESARQNDIAFANNDILVVAQKVVSKAEGQSRLLSDVVPSAEALKLAQKTEKDPRIVELILQESVSVVRQTTGLIIAENRLGIVMANAGIDQSNIEEGHALLLPRDPDASAKAIQDHVRDCFHSQIGVIIVDSIGRAWRKGVVGHAIGVAGIHALLDLRGRPDRHGRDLRVTEVAIADEIAAAGSMLMGQADEGKPVVLVRGFHNIQGISSARALLRSHDLDLFR